MWGSAIESQTGMRRSDQLYKEWRKEKVGSDMARAKFPGLE